MPAPTDPTNYEKVLRCVEYNLNQITHDNNYRTNGMWVQYGGDLTEITQDWPDKFNVTCAAAFIVPADDQRIEKIGMPTKMAHEFLIYCRRDLTVEDAQIKKRRLIDLRADTIDDINRMIYADYHCYNAAVALGFQLPPGNNDGLIVSCNEFSLADVIADGMTDNAIFFACKCRFTALLKYTIQR